MPRPAEPAAIGSLTAQDLVNIERCGIRCSTPGHNILDLRHPQNDTTHCSAICYVCDKPDPFLFEANRRPLSTVLGIPVVLPTDFMIALVADGDETSRCAWETTSRAVWVTAPDSSVFCQGPVEAATGYRHSPRPAGSYGRNKVGDTLPFQPGDQLRLDIRGTAPASGADRAATQQPGPGQGRQGRLPGGQRAFHCGVAPGVDGGYWLCRSTSGPVECT